MREDDAQRAVFWGLYPEPKHSFTGNCESVPQVPAISPVQYSKHSERIVFFAKPSPSALEITSQGIYTSTPSCRQLQVAMSSC